MKMYFKCFRQYDGKFSEWNVIAALPDEWLKDSTVATYPNSCNRIYNVPGDGVRYYEMIDGSLCHNCSTLIDKSTDLHAENRVDREKNLCKKCWKAINHGELNLPQLIGNIPIYRVRNNPVYNIKL